MKDQCDLVVKGPRVNFTLEKMQKYLPLKWISMLIVSKKEDSVVQILCKFNSKNSSAI